MRIALLKAVPLRDDMQKNIQVFEGFARYAASRGSELLCTCECYLDGYNAALLGNETPPDLRKEWIEGCAVPINHAYINHVRSLAQELSMHIVFGFSELSGPDAVKNAALFIGPDGQDIGLYHKTHLLNHDTNFVPGDDLPVFETQLGQIGMVICADRRWPETVRVLRCRGAKLVLMPTYGMRHMKNEWWMRTRAYENEMFLAFCHPETSFICNPEGDTVAKLESNLPDVLIHDIDLSLAGGPMFAARRPELYSDISRI